VRTSESGQAEIIHRDTSGGIAKRGGSARSGVLQGDARLCRKTWGKSEIVRYAGSRKKLQGGGGVVPFRGWDRWGVPILRSSRSRVGLLGTGNREPKESALRAYENQRRVKSITRGNRCLRRGRG